LKEVVSGMEREACGSQNFADREKLSILLTRWRKKVYEGLVTNKRFELIIQDNLRKFAEDQTSLQAELTHSNSQLEIAQQQLKAA
jgi:hypothetical protein